MPPIRLPTYLAFHYRQFVTFVVFKFNRMRHSKIVGLGHHVPDNIITNEYLSTIMDTNNEWIVERTGIHERRWINPEQDTVANMAAKATRMEIGRASCR